jgi:hypothetical protein
MIDFIVDTVFWFVVFWLIIKVWQTYLVAKNELLLAKIKEHNEQVLNNIIQVNIEKHNDTFYLYEKDTQEFIAQGVNFEEVKRHCEARFKGKAVVADEIQMERFGLK